MYYQVIVWVYLVLLPHTRKLGIANTNKILIEFLFNKYLYTQYHQLQLSKHTDLKMVHAINFISPHKKIPEFHVKNYARIYLYVLCHNLSCNRFVYVLQLLSYYMTWYSPHIKFLWFHPLAKYGNCFVWSFISVDICCIQW